MTAPATANEPITSKVAHAKAETFRLLAEPVRLMILGALAGGPRNVTELCADAGRLMGLDGPASQPTLSHHLALLRVSEIVESARSGKNNIYSLTERGARLVAEAVAVA